MVSRRYITSRALIAAAMTSFAAAGMVALSATALADEGDDKPLPGTTIIRSADRGVAQAGASTVTGAPRGTAWSDGDDASKGSPILIHDGNQSPLCYINAEFDVAGCGLG